MCIICTWASLVASFGGLMLRSPWTNMIFYISALQFQSKPRSLETSKPRMASAGIAKRKQFALFFDPGIASFLPSLLNFDLKQFLHSALWHQPCLGDPRQVVLLSTSKGEVSFGMLVWVLMCIPKCTTRLFLFAFPVLFSLSFSLSFSFSLAFFLIFSIISYL